MIKDLSYQIYSEFKTSDWYIYWDKEFSRAKNSQLLVVWHVKGETYTYYDYVTLNTLLKTTGTPHTGLTYQTSLNSDAIKEFTAICNEFIADVDAEFNT